MQEEYGSIDISDSVIKEIAIRSALEYYGRSSKIVKKIKKSIEVERTPDDKIVISLRTDAPYGVPIPSFVSGLIERIKKDVEMMTSYAVDSVNITIEDVYEKEEKERVEEGEYSE